MSKRDSQNTQNTRKKGSNHIDPTVTNDLDIHHGILTLNVGVINATKLILHGEQLIDPAADQFEPGDTRVTLTGNGQINANVINGGGFVEPGLSIGVALDVSLVDLGSGEFVPAAGDSFGFLSATGGFGGAFDTLNLPDLSGGLQWQLNPGGNTLFLNVVGVQTTDTDGDGDGADFLAWQRQFGLGAPTHASSQTVPEPHSLLLASYCVLFLFRRKASANF